MNDLDPINLIVKPMSDCDILLPKPCEVSFAPSYGTAGYIEAQCSDENEMEFVVIDHNDKLSLLDAYTEGEEVTLYTDDETLIPLVVAELEHFDSEVISIKNYLDFTPEEAE